MALGRSQWHVFEWLQTAPFEEERFTVPFEAGDEIDLAGAQQVELRGRSPPVNSGWSTWWLFDPSRVFASCS
jgi:hypothetical protein